MSPQDQYSKGAAVSTFVQFYAIPFALYSKRNSHAFELTQGQDQTERLRAVARETRGPIRIHKLLKRSIVCQCREQPFKQWHLASLQYLPRNATQMPSLIHTSQIHTLTHKRKQILKGLCLTSNLRVHVHLRHSALLESKRKCQLEANTLPCPKPTYELLVPDIKGHVSKSCGHGANHPVIVYSQQLHQNGQSFLFPNRSTNVHRPLQAQEPDKRVPKNYYQYIN